MGPLKPFRIAHVADPAEAVAAAVLTPGSRWLAGGTTLVDLLKLEVETPELVIYIGDLPLDGIEELPNGVVRIGAMARMSDAARHPLVATRYPLVAQALLASASPQLRNMATVGGNLMQRTRCPYFRDTTRACNKRDPGSGCSALDGYTRSHAVLGTSEQCIATHPADMPVTLVAIEATVRTQRLADGERSIPIGDLYVAYGDDPARETVLEHGELITAIDLPSDPWLARSCFVKARDRASFGFALAAAAVALDVDAGIIRQARVALGGVATKPWRSREAEEILIGGTIEPECFAAAANAALRQALPRRDNAFKPELARRTVRLALATAAARA